MYSVPGYGMCLLVLKWCYACARHILQYVRYTSVSVYISIYLSISPSLATYIYICVCMYVCVSYVYIYNMCVYADIYIYIDMYVRGYTEIVYIDMCKQGYMHYPGRLVSRSIRLQWLAAEAAEASQNAASIIVSSGGPTS